MVVVFIVFEALCVLLESSVGQYPERKEDQQFDFSSPHPPPLLSASLHLSLNIRNVDNSLVAEELVLCEVKHDVNNCGRVGHCHVNPVRDEEGIGPLVFLADADREQVN